MTLWARILLAASATLSGLVLLALFFAGPATYEAIARENGFERNAFHVPGTATQPREVRYEVRMLAALHEGTLRYVLGEAPGTPRDPTTRDPLFSPDEQRHLSDVRDLFGAARWAAVAGLAIAAALVGVAARRGRRALARDVRDAAALSGVPVTAIGAVAAFAFEPAFLAFHYVLFPQGNFLFDPATSNLLALYPEAYWYAVALRIGASFVALAAIAALAGELLARAPERDASAIVSAP